MKQHQARPKVFWVERTKGVFERADPQPLDNPDLVTDVCHLGHKFGKLKSLHPTSGDTARCPVCMALTLDKIQEFAKPKLIQN